MKGGRWSLSRAARAPDHGGVEWVSPSFIGGRATGEHDVTSIRRVGRAGTNPLAMVMVLLAALVLGLTSCGDGQDGPDDGTADGGSSPTPDAPATPDQPDAEGTTTASVFFSNDGLGDPCGDVFPVQREVAAEDPIGETVRALLAGPSEAETAQGYSSWFSSDTAGMLHGYRSEGGILYVDFADFSSVIPNASSSCGSAALLAALDNTLQQFDGVEEARYSFDGSAEAFYEWLQLAAP